MHHFHEVSNVQIRLLESHSMIMWKHLDVLWFNGEDRKSIVIQGNYARKMSYPRRIKDISHCAHRRIIIVTHWWWVIIPHLRIVRHMFKRWENKTSR